LDAFFFNQTKAKRAVAAMISRSKEDGETINSDLTEEETVIKLQNELCPLLTGGQLKSYQLKGVKWLISLWQNGLNGILADQMGLGKTIQTIGFLSHLKGNGLDGPYLVIAPLSTLSNWFNEIARYSHGHMCLYRSNALGFLLKVFLPFPLGSRLPSMQSSTMGIKIKGMSSGGSTCLKLLVPSSL